MGTALSIASVTCVLKDLLYSGLIDHDLSGALGGNFLVTALPPDKINDDPATAQQNRLNLFLHQVTPNQGWRNRELPTRDQAGDRVTNPLLPLNLHYLLTAYGEQELHGEILLGYAMLLLHENAILSRGAIRTALAVPSVNGTILPKAYQALVASELADQVELIKITLESFDTDHTSKLWTALQTHYRLSAAYEVSVVLIESLGARRSPLPVLSRGAVDPASKREAGIVVRPNMVPPYPTLESIVPLDNQTAVRMDETVTLRGHDFPANPVDVQFSDPHSGRKLILAAATGAMPTQLTVKLPKDPASPPLAPDADENPDNWRAGIYAVAVVIQSMGGTRTTNALPLVLAPTIKSITATFTNPDTEFTVTCSPKISATQRVSLIVDSRELDPVTPATPPPQPPPPQPPPPTDTIVFKAKGFTVGQTLRVRLRVDGAESILINRTSSPPGFFPSEQVQVVLAP